jgi:hypothetical protein
MKRPPEGRVLERRSHQRHPRLKAGSIVFKGLGSVLDCTVRNISDGGACLIVANSVTIPVDFRLRHEGELRACAITWRLLNRIGVKFN